MIRNFKVLTVLVIMVFAMGFVAPQPAHAGFIGSAVSSIGSAVGGAVSSVTSAVSGVVDTVKSTVGGAINAVKELGTSAYNTVKETVKSTIGKFTGQIAGATGGITDAIGKVSGAASSILPGGSGGGGMCGLPGMGGALDSLKNLGGAASSIIDNFKRTTSSIGDIMKNKDMNLFDKIKGSIGEFKGFVDGNLDGAKDALNKFISGNKDILQSVLQDPSKLLGDVINPDVRKNPIIEEFSKMGEQLMSKGMDFGGFVKEQGQKLLSGASNLLGKGKGLLSSGNAQLAKSADEVTSQMAALSSKASDPIGFNKTYGELYSAVGDNTRASASLAGFKIERGSNISGGAMNEGPKKNQESIILDGHLGARFDAEGKWEGDNYSIQAKTRNVAGLSGYAEGSAKWMKDGTLLQTAGRAEAVAGLHSVNQLSARAELGDYGAGTDVYASAMVGAGAKAKGKLYAGNMGVEVKGGAEARVGAWVEGEATNKVTYKGESLFTVKGKAGAGLGLGAGAGGGVSFRLDKVGFEGDVTLGPFKLGGGVYVNPKAVGQLAWDKGKQLGNTVADGAKNLANGAKDVAGKAGRWFKSIFD